MVRSRLRCRMVVRLSCRRTIVSLLWRLVRTIHRSRWIRLRPVVRSGLIRLGPIVWRRLARLRTVVGLRHRMIRLRIIRSRPILRSRRGPIVGRRWPVVRSRCIWLRTVIRLRHRSIIPRRRLYRTVRRSRWIRLRLVRLWPVRLWPVRLRIRGHRARAICRLIGGCRRRCRGPGRRNYIHARWCSRRSHLRQLLPGYRLAGMLGQHLLPRRKRRRWRRWCGFGKYLAICNGCRWCRYMRSSVYVWSHYSLRCRSDSRPGHDGRIRELPRIHPNRCFPYWLRTGKRLLWYGSHASLHITVHVRDVVDGRVVVHDCRVVNVRDLRRVHSRARDIHPVHVRRAHVISRHEHFTRPQWEPRDICS